MSGNSPCNGCERRLCGCHAQCPDYGEWKKEQDRERDARNERSRTTPEWPRGVLRFVWREWKGKRR